VTLKLPKIGGRSAISPVKYDPSNQWDPTNIRRDFARRDAELTRADEANHKRGRDLEVGAVAMTPPDPTKVKPIRLILSSPNGTRWSITVDDTGVISGVAIS
jgi:hypothetical protein